MLTLLRTEWLKMRKYNAFWWIMGVTALSYPGINLIFQTVYDNIINEPGTVAKMAKAVIPNPFAFPEAWNTVAYTSSCFVFIPAVLVIMFISNEYTYRTHRQNIIDGWSRRQFITSKLVDVLVITLIITALNLAMTLIIGFSNLQDNLSSNLFSKSWVLLLFAIQTFSQLSIAFLVGFLVRKAFLALGIFLFYYLVLENILVGIGGKYLGDIFRFLPFEISDRMIPHPFLRLLQQDKYDALQNGIPLQLSLTVLVTVLTWYICYRINDRKDLK